MSTEPIPTPLPSPLSYPHPISRPAIATLDQREAALKHIALMAMKITGCSRADAYRAAQAMVAQLEEGRDG